MRKILLFFSVNILTVVSIAQTGPGGVGNSSTNKLWLKGDGGAYIDAGITSATSGQQVRQWNDNSGNGNNATQSTAGNRPLFAVNTANGFSGLRFTGNTFIDGPALGIASTSSYTYLMVFKDTVSVVGGINDGSGHFILDRTTATNNLVSLKPISGNVYAFQKRNNAGGGLGGPASTTNINANYKIVEMRRDYNVDYRFFYDGTQESAIGDGDGATTPPNPRIGRHATTANNGLRGYINEFVIYNFALNTAQTLIVNNYLAAKYGLTLSTGDIYNKDDVGQGNYDYEVAGIGRVDASNMHNDAQGTGMVRILNPTGLGNNEFLIWGHDNRVAQAINTTDIPATVLARFDRVWRVSEVNTSGGGVNVGNIDMRWDLTGLGAVTASDLRLLVDTDNDGIFSDETPISGATSLGGNIYQFAGVSAISNNRRFTLATIDRVETPLPIELLSFEATINEGKVDLRWITATEINNDYFTIERSDNLKDWNEVVHVKGAENSNQELSYYDVDYFPIQGISYYRLKQTDFDGKFTYSNIVPVNFISSNIGGSISLFPNPTGVGKTVNLEFKNISESEILVVLRDMQGKEYYSKIAVNIEDGNLVGVPIETSIPAGIYLVTATSENQIYSQKLIVR